MFPYLDGALRRDLPHVAAVVLADLEKARITKADLEKARITKGMHVLAAGDRAKKGVVETDDRSSNPYKVRWSDGELSKWLVPADIVLDEAAEAAVLQTKVVQIKTQMLSDFETLCAAMKTPEKISPGAQQHNCSMARTAQAACVVRLLTPGAPAQAEPGRQLQAGRGRCHWLQAGRAHAPRQGARASPPMRSSL